MPTTAEMPVDLTSDEQELVADESVTEGLANLTAAMKAESESDGKAATKAQADVSAKGRPPKVEPETEPEAEPEAEPEDEPGDAEAETDTGFTPDPGHVARAKAAGMTDADVALAGANLPLLLGVTDRLAAQRYEQESGARAGPEPAAKPQRRAADKRAAKQTIPDTFDELTESLLAEVDEFKIDPDVFDEATAKQFGGINAIVSKLNRHYAGVTAKLMSQVEGMRVFLGNREAQGVRREFDAWLDKSEFKEVLDSEEKRLKTLQVANGIAGAYGNDGNLHGLFERGAFAAFGKEYAETKTKKGSAKLVAKTAGRKAQFVARPDQTKASGDKGTTKAELDKSYQKFMRAIGE